MKKKYDNKYNQKRNRRRFKAMWVGDTDEGGFVSVGKSYVITEVKSSGHYTFINNFGQNDMAHSMHFETIKPPRLRLERK